MDNSPSNPGPSGPHPDSTRTALGRSGQPLTIGDYRITRVIGEGGMGVVYEAEQQHPRRLVALKVIRGAHVADDARVRLFLREAQTLARLKHPGIASIYESGRTDDGQHYFAMELVRGETLAEFIRRRGVPTGPRTKDLRERLALLRKICEPITYAHQRGVLHRDLKPSNIVLLRDPQSGSESGIAPDIKILDFGLARITETDVTVSTLVTEPGIIQGTLPYMSPEQIRGNPDEIDSRTDLYSLGVILYELLTGHVPFDLSKAMLHEAARIICEQTPEPPSRRTAGGSRFDRDVETIVLKALEKEPSRRYQNASGLADDIERYLSDQPILARPPSATYQLRKLIARHRMPFSFAAILLALIIAFGGVSAVQARRIASERDRANLEAESSRRITAFMVNLFQVSNPGEARGNSVTAREILDKGASTIAADLKEQPAVRARLLETMGRVYQNLGLYAKAGDLLGQAVDIRRAGAGDPLDLARTLTDLSIVGRRLGQYKEAESHQREALEIREQRLGSENLEVALSLNGLANIYLQQHRVNEAEPAYTRALAIREKILGRDHPDVARTLNNLAILNAGRGRYPEAEAQSLRALGILERSLGPDHLDVAQMLVTVVDIYLEEKKYADAEPLALRSLTLREKALGPEHPELTRNLNSLARIYRLQNKLGDAEVLYRRALAIREKTLGPDHPEVAYNLAMLGGICFEQDRLAETEALFTRALAIREKKFGPDNQTVADSLEDLAGLYTKQRRFAEAEPLYRRSILTYEKVLGSNNQWVAGTLTEYAAMLRAADRPQEAALQAERAAAIDAAMKAKD
jgi:serine/threonine protein kinase